MKIDYLRLKNYRCFEDFTINFPDHFINEMQQGEAINLHVILAPNMVGKSAILKALRIALGTPLQKIKANVASPTTLGITADEHRVLGANPFSDKAREVEIIVGATAERWDGKIWSPEHYIWKKYKEDYSGRNTKTEFTQRNISNDINAVFNRVTENNDGVAPIFLYVGTEYIHQPKPVLDSLSQDGLAKQGYWYCLEDKSMEEYVFVWFKKLFSTTVENHRSSLAKELYSDFAENILQTFRLAVMKMIPDIIEIDWIYNPLVKAKEPWDGYVLTFRIENQGVRTYEMLSDGYRYIILLIGELVTRATLLNKSLGPDVLSQVTGVILIDEFGIHLHPDMQEESLSRLADLFPQVQFIVTTHSPLLINGLRKEQLHKLTEDLQGKKIAQNPDEDAIGLGAEGILREMFDVESTYDEATIEQNEEYKRLLALKTIGQASEEELGRFEYLSKRLAQFRFDPSLLVRTDDPVTKIVKERLDQETFTDEANVISRDPNHLSDRVNSIMDELFKR